jgi:hypothetical protein
VSGELVALIVLGYFVASWPASRTAVTSDRALGVFLLAVLANVAYSVIYVPDVFIQFSGFLGSRARFPFAAVLTHFVSSGAFAATSTSVNQ